MDSSTPVYPVSEANRHRTTSDQGRYLGLLSDRDQAAMYLLEPWTSGAPSIPPAPQGQCCRITRIETTPELGPLFPGGVETGAYRRCLPDQATS